MISVSISGHNKDNRESAEDNHQDADNYIELEETFSSLIGSSKTTIENNHVKQSAQPANDI